jgi:MTH538 TIR-like domain (DUF1863)
MARKVFYSFHYKPDNWRVSQVRKIGALEGNEAAKDNDWETITKGGDAKIQEWIDAQMNGRSCVIVLIGANTAGRKWINYEIKKAWDDGKGLLGIHIHNLKDSDGNISTKGDNPFDGFTFTKADKTKVPLSDIVKTYNPAGADSKAVYQKIADNIEDWIEEAIKIRGKY